MSAYRIIVRGSGNAIDSEQVTMTLDIVKQVDRIPDATLTIVDYRSEDNKLELGDAEFLAPGKAVEIALLREGEPETLAFAGRIVRHGIRYTGSWVLRLDVRDAAVALTRPRRSRVLVQLSDGEVFSQLVRDAGLALGDVAATGPRHAQLVQYRVSDWDFLISRAQALGLCVVADDGTLSLKAPDLSTTPELRLRYETDFSDPEREIDFEDLELELDGLGAEAEILSRAWDPNAQQLTDPLRAVDLVAPAQGQSDPGEMAAELGFAATELSVAVPLDPDEQRAWADGLMRRNRLSRLRGRIGLFGSPIQNAALKPLQLVEIDGVGERYSGKALISGVRHRADGSGWRTDLSLGLDPRRLVEQDDFREAAAAGLIAPAAGLQIGVVADAPYREGDPAGQMRIPIRLPVLGPDAEPVWARLAAPHAGEGHGFVFRPEPKDELVVAFLGDDPRQPVILGALFSGARPPPGELASTDRQNPRKGLVTRSGVTLAFSDDSQPSLSLATPGQNRVELDDGGKRVTLSDQSGNSVALTSRGITIKTKQDLQFEADGAVRIKGRSIDLD